MTFEYIDPLLTKLKDDEDSARREYQSNPPKGPAAHELSSLTLLSDWIALSVTFQLQTPWFSKDDKPFHVLYNPVHRDHVFGAPFMPASSWKGLLRWAARMKTGLLAHLEANNNALDGWKDSTDLIHLFGNERDEVERFQRGALAFRPTWFDRVGFEVINPHDRAKKAGTKPILYEVVPPGATGTLNVLYAPAPAPGASTPSVNRQRAILLLLDAVESLITEYGFSAKRTSGWGVATVKKASLRRRDGEPHSGTLEALRNEVKKISGGVA